MIFLIKIITVITGNRLFILLKNQLKEERQLNLSLLSKIKFS